MSQWETGLVISPLTWEKSYKNLYKPVGAGKLMKDCIITIIFVRVKKWQHSFKDTQTHRPRYGYQGTCVCSFESHNTYIYILYIFMYVYLFSLLLLYHRWAHPFLVPEIFLCKYWTRIPPKTSCSPPVLDYACHGRVLPSYNLSHHHHRKPS